MHVPATGIASTILCITFHLLEASMKKETMVNGSFVKVRTFFHRELIFTLCKLHPVWRLCSKAGTYDPY